MSQAGYTPIQLYRSTTPGAVPLAANLLPGELALNITDTEMAVYTENASGVVKRVFNNPAGLKYPTADGTAGQTLVTNGAGVLGFVAGGDVTLTGVQTLTDKTIESGVLTKGYTEEVFAVTGATPALSPVNGSIQTWTLPSNATPTAGVWGTGQSITLMVNDGTAFSITWTSLGVTWKTDAGVAPTLNLTGYTAIQLWKVASVIYGARVGNA
jgi:hypothetical protein